MSTKTSIKRAALVAVAALTLGGISAVSASATSVPGLRASTTTGATSVTASSTYPQDTVAVTATTGSYVLETVTANAADSVYTITATGGSLSIANPGTTFAASSGGTADQYTVSGNTISWYTSSAPGIGGNFAGTETLVFAVTSATAGSTTLTVTGNTSAAVTQTLTWGAAPAISVANTKSILINTAGSSYAYVDTATAATYIAGVTGDSTTALAAQASGSKQAFLVVQLNNDQSSVAAINGDSLTATVTGPALVEGTNSGAAYSAQWSYSANSTTISGGYAAFGISSTGASGTATITVTYTSSTGVVTVIATKTVSFYSSTIASLKATVNHAYVPLATVAGYVYAGGNDVSTVASSGQNSGAFSTTVLPAVTVVAADANGNAIPTGSVNVSSSNTAVATVTTATTYNNTYKFYYPSIQPQSEGTTTLTFTDAATGAITATAVINVSKAVIASVVTATDASSYDPATAVKYTITAKDAADNLVPDGNYIGFYLSGYEPAPNVALQNQVNITSDTLSTVSGVEATSFFAPVTPGTTVTITGGTLPGTAGAAAGGSSSAAFIAPALNASTQGGVSFTVNGGSDASGATDAANAATDAANAAADAADNATQAASEALAAVNSLATTVASLIAGIKAQITSLTNLITKIKNKVGA